MDTTIQDILFFFDRHQAAYPLYECFQEKLLARFPESRIKVQKSQISYYNRHLYACVSFLKVKKNGAAGRLFCADAGAVRSVGIRPGGGKNRAVSGAVDNAFCHQQSVRFGRGVV